LSEAKSDSTVLLVGVTAAMQDAELKAWEALSGYKFWMFGYHAGRWINYNNLLSQGERKSNPFAEAVKLARRKRDEAEGQTSIEIKAD